MTKENPFPGVNPWMQSAWSDVHTRMISYIADALSAEIPNDLVARAEENIAVSSPLESDGLRKADVAVIESEAWKEGSPQLWTPEGENDLADRVASPVLVALDEVTERWVEVRTGKGKLVTVIELTSPANKTLKGREEFDLKCQSFLDSGVNVVEVDLIRGGHAARDQRSGNWPDFLYQTVVSRPQKRNLAEVYGANLKEPLPVVRIPLRESEADAALDLQELVNRCYRNGRYWMLSYDEAPVPPLADSDLSWALETLGTAGIISQD